MRAGGKKMNNGDLVLFRPSRILLEFRKLMKFAISFLSK